MNWELFWRVFRIGLGCILLLAAVFMLIDSLFIGSVDAAYAMFGVIIFVLGLIMVVFGISTLPKKN